MAKTYVCKLCGNIIRASDIPIIIAKEGLCVPCYQAKYRALGEALKEVSNG